MSDKDFISLLTKTFQKNGLSSLLNSSKTEKFLSLTKRMLEENEKYNLTAIVDPKKIILLHYADCVSMADAIPEGARIIDVGCGAGFPSLPLAIVREDVSIYAIDSTAKRINYVNETADMLGITNIKAEAMRAEDGARSADSPRHCSQTVQPPAVTPLSSWRAKSYCRPRIWKNRNAKANASASQRVRFFSSRINRRFA